MGENRMENRNGDLNSLYEKIEGLERLLAKKREEYVIKALEENGGSIKLQYNPDPKCFDGCDMTFEEQFPETVVVPGGEGDFYAYLTEVSIEKISGAKFLFIKGIDIERFQEYEVLSDYCYQTGICRFINHCLKQKEQEKEKERFEAYLNSTSPDPDSEKWIIGGENRYCQKDNLGTMLKRYDPIAFESAYKEWRESDEEIIWDYRKIVEENKAGNNICFINRGEWSDPEIAYKGELVSQEDVEDYLDDQCMDTPSYEDWEEALKMMFEDYDELGLMDDLDEFKISDAMSAFVLKRNV